MQEVAVNTPVPKNKYIKVIVLAVLFLALGLGVYFFSKFILKKIEISSFPPPFITAFDTAETYQIDYGNHGYTDQFVLENVFVKSVEVTEDSLKLTVRAFSLPDYFHTLTVKSIGNVGFMANGTDQGVHTPPELAQKLTENASISIALAYIPTDSPLDRVGITAYLQEQVATGEMTQDEVNAHLARLKDWGTQKSNVSEFSEIISQDNQYLDPAKFSLVRVEYHP